MLTALSPAMAAPQRSGRRERTSHQRQGRADSYQPQSRKEHMLTGVENTYPGPKTPSAEVMGFGVALVGRLIGQK